MSKAEREIVNPKSNLALRFKNLDQLERNIIEEISKLFNPIDLSERDHRFENLQKNKNKKNVSL